LTEAKDLEALDHPLFSPNGLFEVYWAPEGKAKDVNGNLYDYGTKLFLRRIGGRGQGVLLRENARWMAARWFPNSTLLGVEDHWDGHVSDVYVYEVTISADHQNVIEKQVFRSPESGYDLRWFIETWIPSKHTICLRREQRTHDGIDVPKSWANHSPVEYLSYRIDD
jgi:hypothetical protein